MGRKKPIIDLGEDGVYRQIKRWNPRERLWGALMLIVVIVQPIRWVVFDEPISKPLLPVFGLLTVFGVILYFFEKKILISNISDSICVEYKLLIPYLRKCHNISDVASVRIREYFTKGNTRSISGVEGSMITRIALAKEISRTGPCAFGDGVVEIPMWELSRYIKDNPSGDVDIVMQYAKELGAILDLPVEDNRKH